MSNAAAEAVSNNLRPVQSLIEDPTVSEILINGPNEIFVERKGKLEKTDVTFRSEDELVAAVNAIANSIGRRINEEEPRLDARLPDGSRIHAVLKPLASSGTIVSIRKFFQVKLSFKDYIKMGAITPDAANFLEICMFLGKNILVSGGTGSGKTTLLNLLCSRIPKGQRVITIEDSRELAVDYEHVVSFETRMPNEMGKYEVSMKDLLKSSLRLRPDRIIVGEVRGSEGLELIQAMNTGHKGCLGTVHANTAADAMVRLETLAMGGDSKVSEKAMRYSVASAIHLVVQISRLSDGSRRIMEITECIGLDDDYNYVMRPIYQMGPLVRGLDGKLTGSIEPSGQVPSFIAEIEDNRIPFPRTKFVAPSRSGPAKAG
ncbi:CpaF family protein [soil metagenome]